MSADPATFYSRTRAARKVSVVDLGFLGDTVHLVPALWEIKRGYPQATLHVLTSTVGAQVLALAPCVDRAWSVEMYPDQRTLSEQWRVLRALRRERFDVSFNFSGADRSVFAAALIGARWRVAHPGGRKHFWNPWLIADWVPRQDPLLPVYEQRRRVLAACGLSLGPPVWNLRLPETAVRRAESLVAGGAIHFSINASSPLKEWPLARWIDLAGRLLAAEPAMRIVATASATTAEQHRLQALMSGVNNARLTALPPGLAIAELAAVLQRCRLHVGGDSGVLHLAVALGVPTLSLFREYHDASGWMPAGPAHRVLSVPCRCINQREQPCAASGYAECLAEIQAEGVAALVHERLTATPPVVHT
jgi:ADP-heptose:LPS heptosyltransferase